MKNIIILLSAFFTILTLPAYSEDSVSEKADLSVTLLDRNGQPTTVQQMGGAEVDSRFRFRPTVPSHYSYLSWAIEFSGVSTQSNYRISNDGVLPDVVRWDGRFEDGNSLQLGKRYFYRLLLILSTNEIASSPWVSFETVEENQPEDVVSSGAILDLTVTPTMSLQGAYLKTKSFNYFSPTVEADMGFLVGDTHTVGFRGVTTADSLVSVPTSADRIQYSDVGAYYRYRLTGVPVRGKWLSGIPDGQNFRLGAVAGERETAWDSPWDIELGAAVFFSQWRGNGGTAVDAELPRANSGAALTAQVEHRFELWRLVGTGEVGYSLFKGKIFRASGSALLLYDGMNSISPGFQARYTMLSGTPVDDATDGGNDGLTSVTTSVIQAGLVVHVRL